MENTHYHIIANRPAVISAQRAVQPNSSNSANTAKWQLQQISLRSN